MKNIFFLILLIIISTSSFSSISNAKNFNELGEKYYQLNEYDKAENFYFKAYSEDRTFTQASANLSLLYMKKGDLSSSMYWSLETIAREKKNKNNEKIIASAHYNLGRIFEEKQLHFLATNEYLSAIENNDIQSYQIAFKRAKNKQNSIKVNQKLALQLNDIGEKQYKNKNYLGSIESYLKALKYDEMNGKIWSNLSLSYSKIENGYYGVLFAAGIPLLFETDNIIRANSYYNIARVLEKDRKYEMALLNYISANEENSKKVYDIAIQRLEKKLKIR